MSFSYANIAAAHIELSNLCNAACPFCARNHKGGATRSSLKPNQISLENFKDWFPKDFVERVNRWVFCGTVGDPCMAKDAFEIIRYVRECNPKSLVHVNTNGGMRNPDFWTDLGSCFGFSYPDGQVVFSIDGLKDTNHIYRRQVDWERVMTNAHAFITAGGRAHWEFLIFKHNEHQIEKARSLASSMGFEQFVPKKALGFQKIDGLINSQAVYDKNGRIEYLISPPRNSENQNDPGESKDQLIEDFPAEIDFQAGESWVNLALNQFDEKTNPTLSEERLLKLNHIPIQCKALHQSKAGTISEIYVSSDGTVLPCCYTGTALSAIYDDFKFLQLKQKLEVYGLRGANLYQSSLVEIMSSGFLKEVFVDSWEKDLLSEGRLGVCADACGKNNAIDRIWTHKGNKRSADESQGSIEP